MTLEGYWPLHDGENGKAKDYSGNGNHGSLNGGVTTGVAGKGGLEAMSFDGNDDYISSVVDQTLLSDGYTISVWVRQDSQGSLQSIIGSGASGSTVNIGLRYNDYSGDGNYNDIVAYQYDGSPYRAVGNSEAPTDEWVHIAMTYDGNMLTLYKNGSSLDSSVANNTGDNGDDLQIGNSVYNNSRFFDGAISNVRVYSRALTDAEVRQLYKMSSADVARPRQDGISRYPLDGDATDSWGNNDGTNNGASFVNDSIRGQAAEFVANNGEGIDISSPSNVPSGTSARTISLWHKTGSTKRQTLVHTGTSGTDNAVFDVEANGYTSGNVSNSYTIHLWNDFVHTGSGTTITTGEWVHLCVVHQGGATVDDSNTDYYVNGKSLPVQGSATIDTGSQDISIGYDPENTGNGVYTDGLIDDVRIYDYALTPSEVFELYQWGTKGKDLRKHLVNRRH